MMSLTRRTDRAGRLGAYVLTVPAVAAGCWAGLLLASGDAAALAATPLALAVALSGWFGGLGPGLFALTQAAPVAAWLMLGPGSLVRPLSGGQAAALGLFICGWLGFCLVAGGTVRRSRRERDRCLAAEARAPRSKR